MSGAHPGRVCECTQALSSPLKRPGYEIISAQARPKQALHDTSRSDYTLSKTIMAVYMQYLLFLLQSSSSIEEHPHDFSMSSFRCLH